MNSHIFIHAWVLPWLPLLAERLSAFYPDIRRKITKVIAAATNASESSATGNASSSPSASLSAVRRMVQPWLSVFDKTAADRMLVRAVVPTLIWELRQAVQLEIASASTQSVIGAQFLDAVAAVTAWAGVLPTEHIVGILYGEKVHSTWLGRMCAFVHAAETGAGPGPGTADDKQALGTAIKKGYLAVKRAYTDSVLKSDSISRIALSLGLDLMERWKRGPSPASGAWELLLEQSAFSASKTNHLTYFTVTPHVAAGGDSGGGDGSGTRTDRPDGMSASRRRGTAPQVTFREVVEQRALQLGWEMRPCAAGSSGGAAWEGHQLFALGPYSHVYMHQGVLFVSTGGAVGSAGQYWEPTSLDALAHS